MNGEDADETTRLMADVVTEGVEDDRTSRDRRPHRENIESNENADAVRLELREDESSFTMELDISLYIYFIVFGGFKSFVYKLIIH